MSWRFVERKVKALLEDPEFIKANAMHNPNNLEVAIATALEGLAREYRAREEAKILHNFAERMLEAP